MTDLEIALAALDRGLPVVIPTDTVYGVAARPEVPGAVAEIFRAKGRSEDKPLPVLAADQHAAHGVGDLDERALALAERFWPGPLTIVVRRAAGFTWDLGGRADGTVAVRVPAHEVALGLLRASGPLAVTSANLSGRPPATTVAEARAALAPQVSAFLDGGTCNGSPSTVVSLVGDLDVLREGALAGDELLRALG
jgi:L-threonylcarbamoyladenylate synthase